MRRAARDNTKNTFFGSLSDGEGNQFQRRLKSSFNSLNNLVNFRDGDNTTTDEEREREANTSEDSDDFVNTSFRKRRNRKRTM